MSLIEVIKQICNETVAANKPVEMVYGTVLSVSPFQIKIDQKLILGKTHVITGSYAETDFSIGDCVTMLRVQNGKKYYIIDSTCTRSGGGSVSLEYDSANENLILGR